MKVGIIGCGHIAEVHLRAIGAYAGAQVVGVADAFVDYARDLAARHGIPRHFGDVERLLEEARPDVVHVLTPPSTHRQIALACIDRGCHVLVEKPMALEVADAERMVDAARARGVLLSVDHNYRFEAPVNRVRKLLAAGRLGTPVAAEVTYGFDLGRYPALAAAGAERVHWAYRLNGGPLEDLMPHPASLLLEHVGAVQEVVTFSAHRGVLPAPWPDEIRVLVRGERAHGEILVSFSHRPDSLVLRVRGTRGTATADTHAMTVDVQSDSVLPRAAARGLAGFVAAWQQVTGATANAFRVATGRFDKTGGVTDVVRGLYSAIESGGEPPVTADEGRRVVDLIRRIWPAPAAPAVQESQPAVPVPATPPRVLVTGAGGFVGSHIVERLRRDGVPVRALVRPRSLGVGLLQEWGTEIVRGDLANPETVRDAMDGIETVYHAGAAMGGDWAAHRASTVVGTQNVLTAARAVGARLVHLSSLVVYRVTGIADGARIDESWPYEPRAEELGPYTRAKIEAERSVFAMHAEHGLPVSILRPGIVIGPRGRPFFPHLGFRLKDRVFIVPGKGDTVLPLVSVDNVVEAALRCATRDVAVGRAYNIVDDGSVTVLDYLQRFNQATGSAARIVKVPFFLPYTAAAAYEVAAAVGVVRAGVTSRLQMSWKHKTFLFPSERARRELDDPFTLTLDDALARVFRDYAAGGRA